jgi:polysaccharide export outer membrane protein
MKTGALYAAVLAILTGCASGGGPGYLRDARGDAVATPDLAASAPPGVASAASGPDRAKQSMELAKRLASLPRSAGDDESLPLGAGDLVEVSVFDVPEFSGIKARIPNNGEVTLPLIGAVPAAGLTAFQLEAEIRARLTDKYMHNPQVSVFVSEHKSQRVSVIGAVKQGGVFPLTGRLRLADALALAGGLSEEAGSTVYLVRQAASGGGPARTAGNGVGQGRAVDRAMAVIDLQRLADGREELNLPLQGGDVVEVPRAGSIYVGGEVNKPGSIPLKARTTLDQAVVAAGGAKDVADRDDVRMYRTRPDGTREVTLFSMNELEAGTSGPELQPDDVVIVGRSTAKAVLYGLRDFIRLGIGMSVF